MDFAGAIKDGFLKYANFSGVSSRSAYWYWRLFVFIVQVGTTFIPLVGQLASLALWLPDLTIFVRRARDAGFSAWYQLLWVAPAGLFVGYLPQMVAYVSANPIDFETASDTEVAKLITQIGMLALPALFALFAVSLFFFIVPLLPSKTAAQGNKFVK